MKDIYTAGLFDGEGTVTLTKAHKRNKFRAPVVSVTSTSIDLLNFLKENYGGYISQKKLYKKHHKQSWAWSASYDIAILFLSKITPFLKEPEKLRRARLILKSYKSVTQRNGQYTEKQYIAKLTFEQQFFHPEKAVSELFPESLVGFKAFASDRTALA